MLETLATLILVGVGALLFLFVLAYGIYITYYPLTKTAQGAIEVMREYAEERKRKRQVEKQIEEQTEEGYIGNLAPVVIETAKKVNLISVVK